MSGPAPPCSGTGPRLGGAGAHGRCCQPCPVCVVCMVLAHHCMSLECCCHCGGWRRPGQRQRDGLHATPAPTPTPSSSFCELKYLQIQRDAFPNEQRRAAPRGGAGTPRVAALCSPAVTNSHLCMGHSFPTGAPLVLGAKCWCSESPEGPRSPASPLVCMCASVCVSVSTYVREHCHTKM